MKLYGAKISQNYIEVADRNRKPVRYPFAEEYPKEAEEQQKWRDEHGKSRISRRSPVEYRRGQA